MSKNLFELMRMEEMAIAFPTKKELEHTSRTFIKELIDDGNIDKFEAFAQAERMSQAVTTVRDELKASLPRESCTAYGISVTPVNGRQIVQFQEDPIYCELLKAVKDREELLKLALKQAVIDGYGNDVPRVSVKFSADSLTVKY